MVLVEGVPEAILPPALAVLEPGQSDWSLLAWEDPFIGLFIPMMISVLELL